MPPVKIYGAPDNLVQLTPHLNEAAPLEVAERRWDECAHRAVSLDTTLRIITCRDCGQTGIDAFDHLVYLAREWKHWQRQKDQLRTLNETYETHRREVWERRRDRHLKAHPDHVLDYTRTGWSRGECRQCAELVSEGHRYQPRQAAR